MLRFFASSKLHLSLIVLMMMLSIVIIIIGSPYGIGTQPDTVAYFSMAKEISEGELPQSSLWPIGYPLLLGFLKSITHLSFLEISKVVSIVLFPLNLFLGAWLVYRKKEHHSFLALLISYFFLTGISTLEIHFYALSDALFMTTILTTLLATVWWSRDNKNWKKIVLVGICTSCSIMVRFPGLALVPGIILFILIVQRHKLLSIIQSVLFGVISVIPLIIWFQLNGSTGSVFRWGLNSKTISLLGNQILAVLSTTSKWLLPERIPTTFRIVFLFICILIIMVMISMQIKSQHENFSVIFHAFIEKYTLAFLAGIIGVFYFVLFVFEYTLVGFIEANNRTLMPLYLMVIIFFIFIGFILFKKSNRLIKLFITTGLILFTFFFGYRFAVFVNQTTQEGAGGYSVKGFMQSQTMFFLENYLQSNPKTIIYSNIPDGIYLRWEINTLGLPRQSTPGTLVPNNFFEGQINQMVEEMGKTNAILVYHSEYIIRRYLPSEEFFINDPRFEIIAQFSDGIIFKTK